ncbi:MAG: glycosyltransferase family 4 protein [Sphingobacteriales bacterium]|nr:glycosyltransferase family 4 protein [Sphingobacteriales bacterium]
MYPEHPENKTFLLLTLRVFSATGGIEQVCKVAGKALFEASLEKDFSLSIYSLYDRRENAFDNPYFPADLFSGFGEAKISFLKAAVHKAGECGTVLLSHANLLPLAWMIRKRNPHTKIILLCHGIEIWNGLPRFRKKMLKAINRFIGVSHFTCDKIKQLYGFSDESCRIVNNPLDPYLPLPYKASKAVAREGFEITPDAKVLLTLTRISSEERYKGYDRVIEAMAILKDDYPELLYIIAGKYDDKEYNYIQEMIRKNALVDKIKLLGFIADEDIPAIFAASDLYIMPSTQEGFGIVFIEAMYYGIPVIAGNADGSVDALADGKLGVLVDPTNITAISEAIRASLQNTSDGKTLQLLLNRIFGYDRYKINLLDAIHFN